MVTPSPRSRIAPGISDTAMPACRSSGGSPGCTSTVPLVEPRSVTTALPWSAPGAGADLEVRGGDLVVGAGHGDQVGLVAGGELAGLGGPADDDRAVHLDHLAGGEHQPGDRARHDGRRRPPGRGCPGRTNASAAGPTVVCPSWSSTRAGRRGRVDDGGLLAGGRGVVVGGRTEGAGLVGVRPSAASRGTTSATGVVVRGRRTARLGSAGLDGGAGGSLAPAAFAGVRRRGARRRRPRCRGRCRGSGSGSGATAAAPSTERRVTEAPPTRPGRSPTGAPGRDGSGPAPRPRGRRCRR